MTEGTAAGGNVVGDDQLVERLRAGDAGALEPLLDRHGSALLRYLQRLTGVREVAEDLVQEAFLRLLRGAGDYRPGGAGGFAAWAYAIARNLAVDWMRRRTHERRHAAAARERGRGRDEAAAAGYDCDRAGEAELREKVEAAVASLPEPMKSALVLCAIEGRTYEEAAAMLGCCVKTLSTRVSRARRMLRARLGSYLDVEART